jgi:hypothetical protein
VGLMHWLKLGKSNSRIPPYGDKSLIESVYLEDVPQLAARAT